MALSPEEINEKTFATRFRGLDPVEVKGFLNLVATELSDLRDKIVQQYGKIAEQGKELELAADDRKSFEDVIKVFKKNIETLKFELSQARQKESKRAEECAQLRQLSEQQQQERDHLKTELDKANTSLSEAENKLRMSRTAVEELRKTVVLLEAEKSELKTEQGRLGETIGEARTAADDLINKAQQQTGRQVAAARDEIERLRGQAAEEIIQLREDIDKLKNQRNTVGDELRALLHKYLDRIEDSETAEPSSKGSDYDDLFQKVDFPELAEFDLDDDADELNAAGYTEIVEPEESEESLKKKLQDGGIAYLSDE